MKMKILAEILWDGLKSQFPELESLTKWGVDRVSLYTTPISRGFGIVEDTIHPGILGFRGTKSFIVALGESNYEIYSEEGDYSSELQNAKEVIHFLFIPHDGYGDKNELTIWLG